VAPVSSLEDCSLAIEAGADELYCGLLTDEWKNRYGDSETVSRRQGRGAHVRSLDELAAVAAMARRRSVAVALTLNARYTRDQEAFIARIAATWEEMGGQSVVVADPGLMLQLKRSRSRLQVHASLLTNAFNGSTVAFLAALGASRVILPRELALEECSALVDAARSRGFSLDYEMIVLNQRCPFIDGLCGFHHAVRVPKDEFAQFEYEAAGPGSLPVAWSSDPDNRGHGCELGWQTDDGPMKKTGDGDGPACAACLLSDLARAGARYYKIAGRGAPGAVVARDVRFIRMAVDDCDPEVATDGMRSDTIRRRYAATFGRPCSAADCYYRVREGVDGDGKAR
jgi:collagenase-like PrtC family protease